MTTDKLISQTSLGRGNEYCEIGLWLFQAFLLVLISTAVVASPPKKKMKTVLRELSVCDLARNGKAHDGQTVRVRGTVISTFDELQLVDSGCAPTRSALKFSRLNILGDPQGPFERMMEKCQGADVVFKGVFHESGLLSDQSDYERQRSGTGYGYPRSATMLIEVLAVERVRSPSLPEFKNCSAP